MAADLATLIPTAIAGGGMTWAGTAIMQWMKGRGESAAARLSTDADLAKHQDSLTFQLLAVASTDLAAARAEIGALTVQVRQARPLEQHFYHLQQALEHIGALLTADDASRAMIERSAQAFVNRMKRLTEATGTLANEAQRLASEMDLAARANDAPPA